MYSTGIAYLLWWLSGFGALGFHRFYLGKIGTGLLWMFTGGLLGIGSIYDLITLPSQVKHANNLKKAEMYSSTRFYSGGNMRDVTDGETRIINDENETG